MHPRRSAAVALLIALLLTAACTARQAPPKHQTGAASTGASPSSTAVGIPSVTATKRPLEPIPDVRPKGMQDPPPGNGISRYTDQKVVWRDCATKKTPTKQCATLLVPLDYRHPNGPAITLAIAHRPATTKNSLGALFINPGGPGGSGVDYVDSFESHGLEKSYDIVGWDPRGVGKSTPVECFDSAQMETYTAFDYSPDDPAEVKALTALNTEFGRACLAKSGDLLEHISTADTVQDLNLLRQLLGQRKLTYFGSSYGTSIGAMYATRYPDKVGRMVLDGATNIGGGSEVSQTYGFNRTLGNFAEWCAQKDCRLGNTRARVLDSITGLLQRLDQHPIPGGRRDLTQALATSGLIYALYFPASSWPVLLTGLEQAIFNNDGTALLTWADQYNQRNAAGNFGQFNAAFPAIRCLDITDDGVKGALREWHQVEKKAPTIGPFMGPDLGCPTWPVKSTDDLAAKIKYSGRPPVLILGTTGDPATPYEYAEHMHHELTSSRLITLKGNGHLAFDQSSCVQRTVLAYLVDGTIPADDSICTDS
ncbi:alpha/beta hydrolase [Microlunatus elymi]|uniref:Alpha/beta hydrolase n=1 Tax=Microlunatus elymi TaxID=2596828 RepID=A0A516PVC5_9ACTN|nr:alpha/beta hydrolase [Microlunatus elymi]QDP95147.1 alpha/beta hydrolase [Microlunatus elymi]